MFSFRRRKQNPDRQEPDERAPLLPRATPGYLSPNDPAVSPYNLWSIRLLRGLTTLFLAVSFLWWIFLLVTLFVNPPMAYTRGSGFLGFSYATLTVGYLTASLLFFATPSKPMAICGIILAVFLLADMCIILGVARIRVEEGWVGIASVVWAAFISFYSILRNISVAWGTREEEERLTGGQGTRRTLRARVAVLVQGIIMTILVIISVLLTATLILRAKDASLAAPGTEYFVTGNTYQIHLSCVGNTSSPITPTLLIEAGESPVEQSLLHFLHSTYSNHSIPRYCYWDRPGVAWSDNAPSPHSAGMAADALSEALAEANEEGPFILLAAGIGGIYSRIFASRHLLAVKALFLIDAVHESYLPDLGSPRRGFLLWLRGIVSPLGLDRLAGAIFKARSTEDRIFGPAAYQGGKFLKAKLQESLVAPSITSSEVNTARRVLLQMEDIPLVVVSSGIEVAGSSRWEKAQEDLTRVTGDLSAWDVVQSAPHEVWEEKEGRRVMEGRLKEVFGRFESGLVD